MRESLSPAASASMRARSSAGTSRINRSGTNGGYQAISRRRKERCRLMPAPVELRRRGLRDAKFSPLVWRPRFAGALLVLGGCDRRWGGPSPVFHSSGSSAIGYSSSSIARTSPSSMSCFPLTRCVRTRPSRTQRRTVLGLRPMRAAASATVTMQQRTEVGRGSPPARIRPRRAERSGRRGRLLQVASARHPAPSDADGVRDPLANPAAVLAARQRPMAERLALALSWNRLASQLHSGLAEAMRRPTTRQ